MTNSNDNIRRIVHLAEGKFAQRSAKMSVGVIRYGVHESVAVIDSTQAGKTCQQAIGAGGETPIVSTLAEALALKPDTLLIGTTPVGGRLPQESRGIVRAAIEANLDIWTGLHDFLSDDEELGSYAKEQGVKIWDIRKPAKNLPVGGGLCRWSKSYVSLMVGTDCALGKMTVALEIDREAQRTGINTAFIATGQTGIAIAGWGSPVDAIAGDFMAGAVERDVLSVDGKVDMILVEGQGSLLHPGYSPVTLGLMHGCCPDSMILCGQITRTEISNIKDLPIPSLSVVGKLYTDLIAPVKPSEIVGIAINTSGVDEEEAKAYLKEVENECGLPATDTVRFGAGPLVAALNEHRKSIGK